MTRTITVDDDVFELISELKSEHEKKSNVIRRALHALTEKFKEESTERSFPDLLLSEFRRDATDEGESYLKVLAYALTEKEQMNVREQLKEHNFEFDIIESDMISATLISDAETCLSIANELEKQGWKW